jgi:peptidyl-prolyl cis-trans isomerase SurA
MRVGQANPAEDQELLYLAQILVPLQDGVSSSDLSQAREKAEAILAKVTNEVDFLQYANALVKTDKLVRVQDLGYRSIDRLPKLFIDASMNVKAGQLIPQIVRSPAGFHILKMLDRKAPSQDKTIQIIQNEIRQILITQKPGVLDEDTQRRLRNYRDQVLSKTVDFGDLAKKFSEDKNTASQQGYIGWVSPGQSLAEFDVALANLRAGSVSDPIRTEFGWHLLQVINTRQTEVTLAQQKEFARAAIRQEKLDRAYQDWVRELRDSATIDLRPPYTLQK